jgi:hypothetical protein
MTVTVTSLRQAPTTDDCKRESHMYYALHDILQNQRLQGCSHEQQSCAKSSVHAIPVRPCYLVELLNDGCKIAIDVQINSCAVAHTAPSHCCASVLWKFPGSFNQITIAAKMQMCAKLLSTLIQPVLSPRSAPSSDRPDAHVGVLLQASLAVQHCVLLVPLSST